MTGENNPLSLRSFHQLNAPFVGSWCDYPFEKILSWSAGIFSRWMGLAQGSNFVVLLLQVLAGLSFYGCGRALRTLGENRSLLVACAILFGLSPYAFLQNLQHLTLTACWHLPLLILTLIWFGWPERVNLTSRNGLILGCASAFIAGNLNPYYLGPFLILLSMLVLSAVIDKNRSKIRVYVAIVGSAVTGFLLQNFDTLIYVLQHGRNHEAVSRDLWWMVKFGLYLPDLIFPRAHQNDLINKLSWSLYHSHVPPQLWGESQTVYIGMVAGGALIFLLVSGVACIGAGKFEKISPFFWLSLALLFFSMAGGLNYLMGAFGFMLLRATDRSSILLACMALYFLCEVWPPKISRLWTLGVAVLFVIVGVWDQLPRYPVWEEAIRQRSWKDYQMDQQFFGTLEKTLPKGAMVFELPVKDYPEMGPIREMGDYEHFRPVIHTTDLRVSYGTIKGRGDTDWQKEAVAKSPEALLAKLESYGFAAILINRRAYEDGGALLARQMIASGALAFMENRDFLIFRICPSAKPELPSKNS